MEQVSQAVEAKPSTLTRRKPGRKPKHDWNALAPEIAELLAQGYGWLRLGRRYGVTPMGMKGICERLGLKSRWQLEQEG